jgi:hypothetical protein
MDDHICYDKIKGATAFEQHSTTPISLSQGVGTSSNNSLLWDLRFEFDVDIKSIGVIGILASIIGGAAKVEAGVASNGFSIKSLSGSSPKIIIQNFRLTQEAKSSVEALSDTIFNAKLSGIKRAFSYELVVGEDTFLVTELPIAPDLDKVKDQSGYERFNWEKTTNPERKAIGEYMLGLSDTRITVKDLSKKHFVKIEAHKWGNDSFIITKEDNGYLAHEDASPKAQEVVKTIRGIDYYTAFAKACIATGELDKFNNGPKDRSQMINSGSALNGITHVGLLELQNECRDLTDSRLKNSHSK